MVKDVGIQLPTTHGYVLGKMCLSVYEDYYYSFERIPYAKPPLGELRFKAPVPVDPWPRQLDCREKGDKPLQKNLITQEIEGTEDCLYLNIYMKHFRSAKLLPIMVFFFGGGFEKGDPTVEQHSPDYFMMRDVIVVTISYRVGPLGFLSLADLKLNVPGNAGLKDQLLALQWLSRNAVNFNGDPTNVTVFGESAGAASAHYLMLNPRAKGLFHKAILMSGNVLCPWALSPLHDLPKRLTEALGVEAEDDAAVLAYLQKVPAVKLVRPYLLSVAENLDDCLFQFGPVVEPYIGQDCAIPKPPAELLATAWGNAIPVIMGGTSFEGLLMYARVHLAPFLLLSLKDEPQHMLPLELKRKYDVGTAQALGRRLQKTHFGDSELSLDHVVNYCDYASYKVFWHPIWRVAKARLEHKSAPTYLYRFDFDSPTFNHQRIKYCGQKQRGAAHVDDHSYLWFGSFSWKLAPDSPEFRTIVRMVDMWTSFAANSDPNCASVHSQLHDKWAPIEDEPVLFCLNIAEELQVLPLPEHDKLLTWESVYLDLPSAATLRRAEALAAETEAMD